MTLGPETGRSEFLSSRSVPTAVLTARPAAGRDPTDITLPIAGGRAGGSDGGDEEEDGVAG